MFTEIKKPLLIITIATIMLWIAIRLIFKRRFKKHFPSCIQELVCVSFGVYLAWVFCITLYPTPSTFMKTPGSGSINLVPFVTTYNEFVRAFSLHQVYARPYLLYLVITTTGNVFLFVPFGFLFPQVSKYRTFAKLIAAAFVFSSGIEISQYFLRFIGIYRSVDVDDILLNVLGAGIGFSILAIFKKLCTKPAGEQQSNLTQE
ncbi:MAG: VanZ family protein [Ferruginibacter sp.]